MFGLWALLALGVVLRTVEYGALGSLWLDELFITLNVTTRDWDELLAPLDRRQVAPIGFLAITKAAGGLFEEVDEAFWQ